MSDRPTRRLGPVGWLIRAWRADRARVIFWMVSLPGVALLAAYAAYLLRPQLP